MKVYRFAAQEGYEWVLPKNDADFEVFRRFDGARRVKSWSPIEVKLLHQDEQGTSLAESDFPWLGEHAPVMRPRAIDALREDLAGETELLTLAATEADLKVLNVLRVVDALDVDRSELVRFPSTGRIIEDQDSCVPTGKVGWFEGVQGSRTATGSDLRRRRDCGVC